MKKNEEVKVEYYENGNKKSETHYKNGKKDGLETIWYESGRKYKTTNFKDGKEDGILEYWSDGGYAHGKVPFKNGKKDGVEMGIEGQFVAMVIWKDGVKELETVYDYYLDGDERNQILYKNGEKEMEKVWCDEEDDYNHIFYKNGKKVMKTVFFRNDGRIPDDFGEKKIVKEYSNSFKYFEKLIKNYELDGIRIVQNYWD